MEETKIKTKEGCPGPALRGGRRKEKGLRSKSVLISAIKAHSQLKREDIHVFDKKGTTKTSEKPIVGRKFRLEVETHPNGGSRKRLHD